MLVLAMDLMGRRSDFVSNLDLEWKSFTRHSIECDCLGSRIIFSSDAELDARSLEKWNHVSSVDYYSL